MQYAIINGVRREAVSGGQGTCPDCNADVIAKCGSKVVHHWAHAHVNDCDPWWENETAWHRSWKSLFPESCREISHLAENGEVHRADVKTPHGIVIEFQHSAISDEEMDSREAFYKNLIWVIDGKVFKNNFKIFHKLPSPDSDFARDLIWFKAQNKQAGSCHGLFRRASEIPNGASGDQSMAQIHGIDEVLAGLEQAYCGHHQYDWVRPRKSWLGANCPVYLDFGNEYLVRLETYGASKLPCVYLISKMSFINDSMTASLGSSIGTNLHASQA